MNPNTSTKHFHIRWKGKADLDWECFATREMAEADARYLARANEEFSIEEVNGSCPMRMRVSAP